MPVAIRASTSVEPVSFVVDCVLVDIVLEAIAGNVGRECSIAVDGTCPPIETNGHHSHLITVLAGQRNRLDPDCSAVDDAAVGAVRIVCGSKSRWNESGRVNHLIPTVKPNCFGLFKKNLCGTEVLPSHLHGEKARREAREQRHHRGANDTHAHGYFSERERSELATESTARIYQVFNFHSDYLFDGNRT